MREQPTVAPEEDGADDERNSDRQRGDRPDEHLRDVEPGAGCTEIWEHLSERREE